jgi:hypothetical protein
MKGEFTMSKIPELLDEQIESHILSLESCSGDDYDQTMEDLIKLHKLRQEEAKIRQEDEKISNDRRDRTINRVVNTATAIGTTIGGWLVYDIWQRRGLKFELENVVSSPWLKNLMSNMTKIIHK